MKRCVYRAMCLFVLTLATSAFAAADFSHLVTFGDSLTHNDLLWIYYQNPEDLYGADPAEAVFDKGAKAGDDLTSFALAGMESDALESEIDAYEGTLLADTLDKATMYSVEFGGNDILNHDELLAANAPGRNKKADAIVRNIIDNINDGWHRLRKVDKRSRFIIWTIPDITLTPRYCDKLTPKEVGNLQAHVERINKAIRKYNRFDNVVVLDLYAIIQQFVAEPPVIRGRELATPPNWGDYGDLFADGIHPTRVTNALLANIIIKEINTKWKDNIPLYTQRELADLANFD